MTTPDPDDQFPHDFELRPGERLEVGDDEAQARAQHFRDVLGRYCAGVTVVTTVEEGEPAGLTCQAFTSVSLEPPLVAFLATRQSRSCAAIRRTGHFCVNFLGADQVALSEQMAGRTAADQSTSPSSKFAGVEWSPSKTGSALLAGVVGWVDCTVHAVHEVGDHFLVVGEVVDLAVGREAGPLVYYRSGYHTVDDAERH